MSGQRCSLLESTGLARTDLFPFSTKKWM